MVKGVLEYLFTVEHGCVKVRIGIFRKFLKIAFMDVPHKVSSADMGKNEFYIRIFFAQCGHLALVERICKTSRPGDVECDGEGLFIEIGQLFRGEHIKNFHIIGFFFIMIGGKIQIRFDTGGIGAFDTCCDFFHRIFRRNQSHGELIFAIDRGSSLPVDLEVRGGKTVEPHLLFREQFFHDLPPEGQGEVAPEFVVARQGRKCEACREIILAEGVDMCIKDLCRKFRRKFFTIDKFISFTHKFHRQISPAVCAAPTAPV